MSNTLASLRRKIRSAGDLQSVVRTMRDLAASNISQYETSLSALGDYRRVLELGLGVCIRENEGQDPESAQKEPIDAGEMGVVVFGSDQGLVGQFNDRVASFAVKTLATLPGPSRVWSVGERVFSHLEGTNLDRVGIFSVPSSVKSISPLVGQILAACAPNQLGIQVKHLHLFYNRSTSGGVYEQVHEQLLPLGETWRQKLRNLPWPSKNLPQLLDECALTLRALQSEYLFTSIFFACTESLASENASRLAAMQRADKNIDDLLESLHGAFHRQRQSGIDEELFDVVSGFEALSKKKSKDTGT